MSDTSSLSELARFIGQSGVIASDVGANRRAVNDIILHLLEKEPDRRYQTADGLIYDLQQLGGCRLLVERLALLAKQARVIHGDHRLRAEVL